MRLMNWIEVSRILADISIEVNEINVVSVENMADISIEVNEI